jgi:DNA-binding response OmpR family regulator
MGALLSSEPHGAGLTEAGGPMVQRRRIIVVDDDRDTREMLMLSLDAAGFDVSEASSGLRLISSLHVDRPDAIVLDVMMSWMDGFELCKAIKQNELFRGIPVVFVSGRGDSEDVARGCAAGAADYFTKPVDLERLARRLHDLVEEPPASSARHS